MELHNRDSERRRAFHRPIATTQRAWLAVLTLCAAPLPALAALCTVDAGGGGDYTTIQAAVDDVNCDPIEVVAGTYVENVSIERALTLTGVSGDRSTVVVDGGGLGTVISIIVIGGPDVTIENLTVQNGLAEEDGGGIYAGTGLVLDNAVVQQNVADGSGGGIYVFDGPLTMTNTLVTGNQAAQAGGGLDIRFDSSIADSQIVDNAITTGGGVTQGGGGLNNRSNLTISNTTISGNTTPISGGGVFNNAEFDTLTLTDVVIENNEVGTYAGGVYNFNGSLVIESSQIRDNGGAVFSGGGLYNAGTATLTDSVISGHSASWTGGGIENTGDLSLIRTDVINNISQGRGGGIFTLSGTLGLAESTVSGNTADTAGGGIYMDSGSTLLVLENTEISGNTADSGGGIQSNVTGQIFASTISGNTATGNGGGVFGTGSGPFAIANSTISGNSGSNGAGIHLSGFDVTVNNSTITANSAGSEFSVAGLGVYGLAGNATVRNSIIANQTLGIDCITSGITSAGYNIESETYCDFTGTGDQQNTDPLLLALAGNGGPTQTHALDPSSPAVDLANPAGCESDPDADGVTELVLLVDQRGLPRTDIPGVGNESPDETCDIGAYEYIVGLYSIGGSVSGLAGSGLVLQNNGGDDETITAGGAFTFDTAQTTGTDYEVTVASQPSGPNQECTVTNGSGTVGGANVTDVEVTCETLTYRVGGTVTGLAGTGLVLQNNGGDDKSIASDGEFAFDTPLVDGSTYSVTVLTQPSRPDQTCSVSNGSGAISGGSVTDVVVTCSASTYTVGGEVSGLAGDAVILQINGGDDETVGRNGGFTFDTPLPDGTAYRVSVASQPSIPSQTCTVKNGMGQINGADVTNVLVGCVTDSFSVGGTVSGLVGTGLVLQNNGGDDKAIDADGPFVFDTLVTDGTGYEVTVSVQPSGPAQICTVPNGSGTVSGGPVTEIQVNCAIAEDEVFADGFEVPSS